MIDEQRLQQAGLPHDPHMERTILGAMMLEPAAVADGLTMLLASDFLLESHQRIFTAIRHLSEQGNGIDTHTIRAELARRRELDSVGGYGYVDGLTEGIPRRLHIESYARTVKGHARRRETLHIAQAAFNRAADASEDAQEILESTINALREVAEDHEDFDLQTAGEFIEQQGVEASCIENLATVDGIPMGFQDLDDATLGLQKADLIIVAARPSMGKTAWACNVVHHIAVTQGRTAVLFTLEQKKKAIIRRMLAASSRIELKAIRAGNLRQSDIAVILEQRARIAAANLYIDDTAGLTVSRIRAKCLRLKARMTSEQIAQGLVIFVDQLSHVDGADVATRGMDLRQIVGKQTKAFKRLAAELEAPVVVFNQLGRDVGKRADPHPRLDDLKESGNLEEDADLILFLHRPEYYNKADAELVGVGEIIIAKQRDGETLTVKCGYDGRIVRWLDNPTAKQSGFSISTGTEEQYRHDYAIGQDNHRW